MTGLQSLPRSQADIHWITRILSTYLLFSFLLSSTVNAQFDNHKTHNFISPVQSETVAIGRKYDVKWYSEPSEQHSKVELQLWTTDDTTSKQKLKTRFRVEDTGSFKWNVPNSLRDGNYLLTINSLSPRKEIGTSKKFLLKSGILDEVSLQARSPSSALISEATDPTALDTESEDLADISERLQAIKDVYAPTSLIVLATVSSFMVLVSIILVFLWIVMHRMRLKDLENAGSTLNVANENASQAEVRPGSNTETGLPVYTAGAVTTKVSGSKAE